MHKKDEIFISVRLLRENSFPFLSFLLSNFPCANDTLASSRRHRPHQTWMNAHDSLTHTHTTPTASFTPLSPSFSSATTVPAAPPAAAL